MCPFPKDDERANDNKTTFIEALGQEQLELAYVQRLSKVLRETREAPLFAEQKNLIAIVNQKIQKYYIANEDDDDDDDMDWRDAAIHNIQAHMQIYHEELNCILKEILPDDKKLSQFKAILENNGLKSLVQMIDKNEGLIPIEQPIATDRNSPKLPQISSSDEFSDIDYDENSFRKK